MWPKSIIYQPARKVEVGDARVGDARVGDARVGDAGVVDARVGDAPRTHTALCSLEP